MAVFVMGVDPGFTGAIAFYDCVAGKLDSVHDMPLLCKKRSKRGGSELDIQSLVALIEVYSKDTLLACIEEVGATNTHGRKQGAVSMFKFGHGAGAIDGIVSSSLIPIRHVLPQTWKGLMGLSRDKNLSRKKAISLFPDHASLFSRVKDDGRAEASLLAYFGVRFVEAMKQRA